jgi:phospholipase/carboxylesterase
MNKNLTLEYPEIPALTKNPDKLVVLLHGVGSDGHDLISLVPYIQKSLPSCHFISPHGVEAYDMAPFGRQWFSIADRTPEIIRNLTDNNAKLVKELITKKQQELELTNKDTILVGFSQGSMMAVYLTLTTKDPYGSTIAFSGRLIKPTNLENKATPICIIHGKEDDVVFSSEADILSKYLEENHVKYEKLIINNLAHSIDGQGLKFALKFLEKYL